ncbi:hypothetical protein IAU59_002622 [Kwoniella sp. CBS 9459]
MVQPQSQYTAPDSIGIPPPPPLEPETTNTLALLLPNQALFDPQVLSLLRDHYGAYGEIVHWAPVKGFGRAIVVYRTDEEAERAKREGDWLRLNLDSVTQDSHNDEGQIVETVEAGQEKDGDTEMRTDDKGEGYFTPRKDRRGSKTTSKAKPNELILRLYYLPPTPLNQDPSANHLAVPEMPHNFLISPPGSPPEGWEPIVEDAPNSCILAEDLQRALEALQLNGGGAAGSRNRSGKEVILEEGGVRVEVEDTERVAQESFDDEGQESGGGGWYDVEERLEAGTSPSAWGMPSQSNGTRGSGSESGFGFGSGHSRSDSAGSGSGGLAGLGGLISGSGTPSGRIKIIPTAMPPRPSS